MIVRKYTGTDVDQMVRLWNAIVEEGNAFPQEEPLTEESGKLFFAGQSYCGVAVDKNGTVCGLSILHPNNVGRCGHIANASYAVDPACRGRHLGELLVRDSMAAAARFRFSILQFNAVVESNRSARRLYERLGFQQLGVIPNGFRLKDGSFANICPYYISLLSAPEGKPCRAF